MQPTIWIGDTVATMDMTPYEIGMVNKQMLQDSVSVVMGNKQVEKSVAIRDIPSVVCNNQGDQEVGILMKEVFIVPD